MSTPPQTPGIAYEDLLDHDGDVVWVVDLDGRYLFVNRAWCDIFHRDRDTVVGTTIFDQFPREVAADFQLTNTDVAEAGATVEFDEVVPVGDELRHYRSRKFPLRDTGGAVFAVAGFSRDVTETNRAAADIATHIIHIEQLRELDRAIRNTSTARELAERVVMQIGTIVPALRVSISLLSGRSATELAVAGDPAGLPAGASFPQAHAHEGDALSRGELRFARVGTPGDLPPVVDQSYRAAGITQAVSVPLTTDERLVGLINLGFEGDGAPPVDELALLREMAGPLAAALEDHARRVTLDQRTALLEETLGRYERTHAELQEQKRRLERLRELDEAIRGSDSVDGIAGLALDHLARFLPSRHSAIGELADEQMILRAVSGEAGFVQVGSTIPRVPELDTALAAGEVLRYPFQPGIFPEPLDTAFRTGGIASLLNIPLLARGELVGVLAFALAEDDDADEWQVQLAQEMAGPLATAIRDRRLRAELEDRRAELERTVEELEHSEAEVERHARHLEAVREVERAVRTAQSAGEVAEIALDRIVAVIPSRRASVALFDGTTITILAVRGDPGVLDAGESIPPPGHLDVARLAQGGIQRITNDFDGMPPEIREMVERQRVNHILHAPLAVAGQLLGLLNVATEFPDDVTDDAIAFVQELSVPLAISLAERLHADRLEARTAELERALAELRLAQANQWELLVRLGEAEQTERQRIATDIHDEPLQRLSALALRLEVAARRLPDTASQALLRELSTEIAQVGARMRTLIFELQPPGTEDGLGDALRKFAQFELYELATKIAVDDRLTRQPGVGAMTVLYRVAREAIVNCRKHANATQVTVTLTDSDDGFTAEVHDDGTGFDVETAVVFRPGHLGLASMRERAQVAGGTCTIESAPGQGTTITVWVPAGS